MEKLPTELVCEIIKKLDLNDILACRVVNQKWNSIINENIKINSLAIKEEDTVFNNDTCFLDPQSESFQSSFKFNTNNQDFFQSTFIKTILKNIKYLKIQLSTLYYNSDFNVAKNLNHYVRLESLEIVQLETRVSCPTVVLPNLKLLSIGCYDGAPLKFDVPKLQKLDCSCFLPKIMLVNYDSVTHLFTELYENCIPKFKNLEYFHCEYLANDSDYDENNLPKDILSILPKLKELHCSQLAKKDVIGGVLSSKNKLRRQDFKLFFNSLNIECINQLETYPTRLEDGYEFLLATKENFETLLDNFSRLSNFNQYIKDINYSSLIKKFRNGINPEFFKKFVNIQKVIVDEPVENVDQLADFLSKCKTLFALEFNNSSLGQSFYDNLPNYCPSIKHLRIEDAKIINLDFILKLKGMCTFSINQRPTFDIIQRAFNQIEKLFRFKFQIKKNRYLEVYSMGSINKIKLTHDNKEYNAFEKQRYKYVNCFSKSTTLKCLDLIFEKC